MKEAAPLIHVIDDDTDFQTAVSRLLRAAGYEVCCYSSAGEFLVAKLDDRPGCLLLDLRMPGPSGLDIQDALARMAWQRPIVFMSGYGDVPTTVRALKGGAVDFLTKPIPRETLLGAVRDALARDADGRAEHERLRDWRSRVESLTARELEVLQGVVAGKLNKVIAAELGVSERTIKAHRGQVMEKMRVASLAELVQVADRLRAAGALPMTPPKQT